eukprot:755848-Hanusia_phi.AAC.1
MDFSSACCSPKSLPSMPEARLPSRLPLTRRCPLDVESVTAPPSSSSALLPPDTDSKVTNATTAKEAEATACARTVNGRYEEERKIRRSSMPHACCSYPAPAC